MKFARIKGTVKVKLPANKISMKGINVYKKFEGKSPYAKIPNVYKK